MYYKTPQDKLFYKRGRLVIKPIFSEANSFSEGLAAVKVKDKCGYINKIGKAVVKCRFSACADFSEGLAVVQIGQ
ncbi:WG repeat-containing protein [Chlorogloea sp. CCALA 695]|uniref:WG repeat-containing protein n=1 Tax=Chlorogloea sp. CCALA 695 TaxID=2107693 RepID=UPI000D07395E|nr:hypothetical protein C7B70_14455 [Chlorogloea sp. CCALA 695]